MSATLAMARLIELEDNAVTVKSGGKNVEVQFNPETLKLSFANEVQQPEGGDQAGGTSSQQFVGAGSTSLSVALWFDVTAMETAPVDDVRRLTKEVLYFMTPQPYSRDATKLVPPAVRFQWANLIFDGLMTSLEESLEFFSPEGKPLRANMNLSFSQQKILVSRFDGNGKIPGQQGVKPLDQAKVGDSVQNMAAQKGKGGDWQAIAEANNIQDPLRVEPGKLLDLSAKPPLPQVKTGRQPTAFSLQAGASIAPGQTSVSPFPAGPSEFGAPHIPAPPLPRLKID